MTIHEADRRELWGSLREILGEPQADTLMSMLPAQPLPELATRDDLLGLRGELRADMSALSSDLRGEFRAEIGQLRAEFGELRGEVRGEIAGVRGEIAQLEGRLRSAMARQAAYMTSVTIAALGLILTLGFAGAFG